MAIQTFPTATGGGIKSVQRGLASAGGTVTITAVDTTKSFVNVFGTTSSGTPALSGAISGPSANVNAANGTTSGQTGSNSTAQFFPGNGNPTAANNFVGGTASNPYNGFLVGGTSFNLNGQNVGLNAVNASFNAASLSSGSTNLVTAVVQGYLTGSTSLVVSGACRWEVVEFA